LGPVGIKFDIKMSQRLDGGKKVLISKMNFNFSLELKKDKNNIFQP
jgi:hypothetical protein